MTYLLLAFEFFKTGLFAIGGGLVTLPYLMEMSQTHPEWFSMDELMNMVAISESTPGPIGINMASYVGYHVGGLGGALIATLSLVLPSFIIIVLIVRILDRYQKNRLINAGLEGLRPAVTGLIAAAGFTVLQASLVKSIGGIILLQWSALLLFVVLFAFTQLKALRKVHPILYIAAGAIAGVVFQL